jgi:uncharacterized damage-inducible protein DinB
MKTELEDFVEHLERYRAVTLQVFDLIDDDDLAWRPAPDRYSLGQQLLHIAQTEDFYGHGLFEDDWSPERARFPDPVPGIAELRGFFEGVRARTRVWLAAADPDALGEVVTVPGSPLEHTLRSWLWFVLEHELHHKGQVWGYLRDMGRTPPFYALPLPAGQRPDVQAREELGGY